MAILKHILVEKTGSVATLTLNRVEVHNALNFGTISELHSAFEVLNQDKKVKIIVLKGNGKSFCSGADIRWFKDVPNQDKEDTISKLNKLPELLLSIYNSPKVTIALLHGSVFGGGIGLASACDFAIGNVNCQFAFREVKLGIIPATISPFVIEKIGQQSAKQLMLTGETFEGSKAKEIGLISHLVEGYLENELKKLIRSLKSGAPSAFIGIKKLVNQISEDELNEKTELLYGQLNSNEAKEGISAFFEKRKPNWDN